jgi:peptide subunit release factor 1 (eRF1)
MNPINKKKSHCPSCGEQILIESFPKMAQRFTCPACEEQLEIINLDPIILDLVFDFSEKRFNYDEYEYWEKYWEKA